MTTETEYEFIPCYKGGRCEDAPCCGCGQESSYYDEPDYDSYYEQDYDEPDSECEGVKVDCPYGGCSDCDDDPTYDYGDEDAAMEYGLFGDC